MPRDPQGTRPPGPIITIHVLAWIGVVFWASETISAFADGSSSKFMVLALAIVLGGAHVLTSVLTGRHNAKALYPILVILIGDSLLTLFVNVLAIVLVAFTVVILLMYRSRSARAWFASA